MGPLGVELLDEIVEAGLLLQKIGAGWLSCFQLSMRCMRSWRPFCCRLPDFMRSMSMQSLSHQTTNRDRLNNPLGLAKSTQLSVLIALDRLNSLKTLSNAVKA